jgi:hypothetical protein
MNVHLVDGTYELFRAFMAHRHGPRQTGAKLVRHWGCSTAFFSC